MSVPMIAMTTSNSTSVNAQRRHDSDHVHVLAPCSEWRREKSAKLRTARASEITAGAQVP